jgi:hypothetical protein
MIWVLLIFYYTNDGKLVHKEEAGPFKTVEACNDAGKGPSQQAWDKLRATVERFT